MTVEWL